MLRRTTATLLRSLRRSTRTVVAAKSLLQALESLSAGKIVTVIPVLARNYFGARSMALTVERPAPSVPAGEAEDGSASVALVNPIVIFVLGGPGSGKGTQCAKIVEKYGFVHLSAGELLRAEINSGSENGTMIQNMIKEGKIVPSEVTVKLLQQAMKTSGKDKFLIDGFPRNEENRDAFERVTGIEPEFILFFDCPEQEMEARILGRNEGRVDDNIETIRKRFNVFHDSSLPVVNFYDSKGKVRKVNAAKTKDEVFVSIQPLFEPFMKKNQEAVQHAHAA